MSDDTLTELQRLTYDLLSDPCWRGSKLPEFNDTASHIRETMERLGREQSHLKEIIMKQQETINKLYHLLDERVKYHT